jgi:hypothetical protein
LKKIYNWALKQNFSMVYPSEYTKMVEGFISSKVIEIAKNRYQILNRGKLNNFRLESGKVDLKKSIGVLSVHQFNNVLYVSTDPKVKMPIIHVIPE